MKGSVGERIAITLICFGYLTVLSAGAVIFGIRRAEYTTAAVARMLVLEIACGLVAVLVLRRRGWTRGDIGFAVTIRSTAASVGVFAVSVIACSGAYAVLQGIGALEGWSQTAMNFTAAPALFLLFLIVNSVFEEVFVTGYLIEASRASGTAYAVSLSTVVRLLYHTYQGPVALAYIVPIGLIFGAVYARYRNLWPLIVAHTLINLFSWMNSGR